jgi:hypothetical protein
MSGIALALAFTAGMSAGIILMAALQIARIKAGHRG